MMCCMLEIKTAITFRIISDLLLTKHLKRLSRIDDSHNPVEAYFNNSSIHSFCSNSEISPFVMV